MRMLAPLLLIGCTGSPDSLTLFGGRNVASYQNAAGQPAFDEQGYGYGLALTWQLPSNRTRLQDERQLEMLETLQLMERDTRDLVRAAPASITVETGAKPTEDGLTLQIKGLIGAAIAAATAGLAVFRKKLGLKLPSFKKKAPPPAK